MESSSDCTKGTPVTSETGTDNRTQRAVTVRISSGGDDAATPQTFVDTDNVNEKDNLKSENDDLVAKTDSPESAENGESKKQKWTTSSNNNLVPKVPLLRKPPTINPNTMTGISVAPTATVSREPNTSDPINTITDALKDLRQRSFVVNFLQVLSAFMQDAEREVHQCESFDSSFHRLLIHKAAEVCGLQHLVETTSTGGKAIVLRKCATMSPNADHLTELIVSTAMVGDPAQGPPPKFKIMARKSSNSDMNDANKGNNGADKVKTLEEREEEYKKARARIFQQGEDSSTEDESGGGSTSDTKGQPTVVPASLTSGHSRNNKDSNQNRRYSNNHNNSNQYNRYGSGMPGNNAHDHHHGHPHQQMNMVHPTAYHPAYNSMYVPQYHQYTTVQQQQQQQQGSASANGAHPSSYLTPYMMGPGTSENGGGVGKAHAAATTPVSSMYVTGGQQAQQYPHRSSSGMMYQQMYTAGDHHHQAEAYVPHPQYQHGMVVPGPRGPMMMPQGGYPKEPFMSLLMNQPPPPLLPHGSGGGDIRPKRTLYDPNAASNGGSASSGTPSRNISSGKNGGTQGGKQSRPSSTTAPFSLSPLLPNQQPSHQ